MQVKFGTDGWRAIIAKDYTFDNLKLATLATAEYFLSLPNRHQGVCVGYDTRFMSAEFARYTAEILSSKGLRVFLSDSFVPTPAISLYCRDNRLAGGIMITASHNPPIYNGFKIKDSYGGSALPESIAVIEKNLERIDQLSPVEPRENLIETTDIKSCYTDYLKAHIDLDAIRDSQFKIAHNAMYGAGQDIITRLLDESMVNCYHCTRNPGFGGINPEPAPSCIEDFIDFFGEVKTDVGIINDGDADRIGMLDEAGSFVDSHKLFAIILKYLVEEKGLRGEIAKTFALTDVIDRICEKNGLLLHLLPVGFKYVSRLMTTNDILMGGEESGGIGITSYLPERDGIFIGLLVLEMMSKKKKTLSGLVQELFDEYGAFYYKRLDLHLDEQKKHAITGRAAQGKLKHIAGCPVTGFDGLDGYKYHFEGGWLLIRPSGTEPVLRLYCEANSEKKVDSALRFAARLA
ncbi:phosphomannomutase [Prosthecochloris sp. GSB1]|uniref:phosphoglucomutase/phosphomannomutase family protein n=1 Tax=Prosthecochloris sp. GSB1 TaxID=281093 RepID=UPI000B8C93C9|nr:phosphoglucomutase/phosphomannomutase family protein [Prosthecochloris sp. GSB1]ASQ89903.1 phosphomannomutase [Prosthecochloris sp. GSB1]